MTLVGKKAPQFRAKAVVNGGEIVDNFSLDQYIGKKYVIFFFYPLDFTFVCPTELLAFNRILREFQKRDAVVVGCSVDSEFSHWAWLNTPIEKGGIKGVEYPLVSDLTKTISANYGVLAGHYDYDEDNGLSFEGESVALRGLFLINKDGVVEHEVINNLELGRSTTEALRMLDSLIHLEKYGEVCPADWKKGEEAMKPTSKGVSEYLVKNN